MGRIRQPPSSPLPTTATAPNGMTCCGSRKRRRYSSAPALTSKPATALVAALLVSGTTTSTGSSIGQVSAQPLIDSISSATVERSKIKCTDDETFKSAVGLTCRDHRLLGCKSGLEQLGYTLPDAYNLLQHCPVACGVPPCSVETMGSGYEDIVDINEDAELMREYNDEVLGQGNKPPVGLPGRSPRPGSGAELHLRGVRDPFESAMAQISSSNQQRQLEAVRPISAQSSTTRTRHYSSVKKLRDSNTPDDRAVIPDQPHGSGVVQACYDGWHPFCQDDPYYTSKTNLPCAFHASFECAAWTKVGYTDMEVFDLINSCPCR